MSLPTVKLGAHDVTRLTIGGNPFSGFSHQSPERDAEMMDYYTVERIKQVLFESQSAGINTCVLRTDPHIIRMLREFRNDGGTLHWIAQMNANGETWKRNVDAAVGSGAIAYYIHGGITDDCFGNGDLGLIAEIIEYVQSKGLAAGLAGHHPGGHMAVYEAGIPADFHVVCMYNCGSLHAGRGEKFDEADPPEALRTIQAIDKPCIAYKILGAGRVDAREAFERAYTGIKPTDLANVGMHTADNPNMVAENVRHMLEALGL